MRTQGEWFKPRAILFDLDGTLFDRDASFLELVQEQYQCFGSALAHIPREIYVQRAVELDAHGYVDRQVVYGDLAREFGLPETLAEHLTGHFWEAYHSFCRCFPEVPSTINQATIGTYSGSPEEGRHPEEGCAQEPESRQGQSPRPRAEEESPSRQEGQTRPGQRSQHAARREQGRKDSGK